MRIVALRVGVGVESGTVVFLAGTSSDTFAVRFIVQPQNSNRLKSWQASTADFSLKL